MALHALEDLEPFLKFSIHLSVKISWEKLQTNIWKIWSKLLEKFKHSNSSQNLLLKPLLCTFSLKFIFFSEQSFYGNYSTLDSHAYKYCNFSRVCLLVKMASKTVTRSIVNSLVSVSERIISVFLVYSKLSYWYVFLSPSAIKSQTTVDG